VEDARSVGSRVEFQAPDSLAALLVELGLPELEGNIDPGKLLLALYLELHQARLGIHYLLNQVLLLDPVEQHIVHRADIVLEKPRPGIWRHEKHRSRKRAAMLRLRPRVSVIQAHLAVGEGPGGALGFERISRRKTGPCPPEL
jgi:hypothetical protein